MSLVKHIDIKEFREFGYLQEVNRQFLHPLGLALEIMIEEDGSEHLSGVWDYRDDPEGMIFADESLDEDKINRVFQEKVVRRPARIKAVGYWVQKKANGSESVTENTDS